MDQLYIQTGQVCGFVTLIAYRRGRKCTFNEMLSGTLRYYHNPFLEPSMRKLIFRDMFFWKESVFVTQVFFEGHMLDEAASSSKKNAVKVSWD